MEKSKYRSALSVKPTCRETGVLAVVVLILITSIITWDLTHQSLPAGGVEAPQGVEAVDGWMVNGIGVSMAFLGFAGLPGLMMLAGIAAVSQPIMKLDSPYAISDTLLVMSNETTLMAVDVTTPEIITLSLPVDSPEQIIIANTPSGPAVIMLTRFNNIRAHGTQMP